LRRKLTGNVITNVITGAVGYALTGGLFGPLTALQTSVLLLQGESALGDRFVKQAKQSLELVDDQAVVDYVNELGARLGKSAGREDFNYEFFVINDENLNAFALPGGKIFINAGAIAKTHSEAELAGLLGHEIAHAVLGHGLQLLAQSSLTSSITQYIPYVGGLAESLITFSYSRDMERQADALGTRLLATNRLAADGLWSLMQTMEQEEKEKDGSRPPEWLSTHPLTADRVKTLKTLIQRGGYNRYAYEGVKEHAPIREKVQKMLQEEEEKTDKIRDRRQTQPTSPSPTPDPSPTPGPSPTPDPSPTPPTGQ
jgi:predicted Zn-dependent protease